LVGLQSITEPKIAAKLDLSAEYVTAIVYLLKHGEERLVSAVERAVIPPHLIVTPVVPDSSAESSRAAVRS
jgi:hypothetical protein